jgi:hypothetical protein
MGQLLVLSVSPPWIDSAADERILRSIHCRPIYLQHEERVNALLP